MIRAVLAALVLALAAGGCGFQLRGVAALPFDTLHISTTSPISIDLKRNIAAGTRTKLVDSPRDAEAILNIAAETRDKVILSFNTAGRVQEYQLRYKVAFRVVDMKGREYLPTSEIQLTRDITSNDALVLAKESEEALMYRDMQNDMVQQIMRRLAVSKPPGTE
jgi:LPS-assembly lipoprotein